MSFQLNRVELAHANGFVALHDLSLQAQAGECMALIGPSGAGKTSLISVLGTALAPRSGSATVLGAALPASSDVARRALRARIGTVHQAPPLPGRQRVVTAVLAGRYLEDNKLRALEDLLADIALGNRTAEQVARSLLQLHDEALPGLNARSAEKILITGAERGVLSFGNCCHPVPGDEIVGYLSAGKGIVVHRLECPNMVELRKTPERCVEIAWDTSVSGDYRVELRIIVANKPGVLAQVAAAVAQANSNIENVEYKERDLMTATLLFTIEVTSRKHLADVMRGVRRLAVVNAVYRHPV